MKQLYIFCALIFYLLFPFLMGGHGFGAGTWIQNCDSSWNSSIKSVCLAVANKTIRCIASYDIRTRTRCIHKKAIRSGQSSTKNYVRLGFDLDYNDLSQDDIVCSPSQEFYYIETNKWLSAYKLHVGDVLLSNNGPITLTYIQLVERPLKVYTIEVEGTHTFFVGRHSLVTHNIFLPAALSISLGMSIGSGVATGASIGSFFGPVTIGIGCAIGGVVGFITKMVCNKTVAPYHAEFGPIDFYGSPADTKSKGYFQSIPFQEKPVGCGNTTPQTPIANINIVVPELVQKDNPEFGDIPEPTKGDFIVCSGIKPVKVGISDFSHVMNFEDVKITYKEVTFSIEKMLEEVIYEKETNKGTIIYHKASTFEDAMKDFENMPLTEIQVIKNGDGVMGALPDRKRVIVRRTSRGNREGEEKWPTLEIQREDGKKSEIKIRYVTEE